MKVLPNLLILVVIALLSMPFVYSKCEDHIVKDDIDEFRYFNHQIYDENIKSCTITYDTTGHPFIRVLITEHDNIKSAVSAVRFHIDRLNMDKIEINNEEVYHAVNIQYHIYRKKDVEQDIIGWQSGNYQIFIEGEVNYNSEIKFIPIIERYLQEYPSDNDFLMDPAPDCYERETKFDSFENKDTSVCTKFTKNNDENYGDFLPYYCNSDMDCPGQGDYVLLTNKNTAYMKFECRKDHFCYRTKDAYYTCLKDDGCDLGLFCDTSTLRGDCVECLTDSDCKSKKVCNDKKCSELECNSNQEPKDHECIDLEIKTEPQVKNDNQNNIKVVTKKNDGFPIIIIISSLIIISLIIIILIILIIKKKK
ncbi:MAG: hypothetical protein U9O94_11490 [Nanoarchaeota archaeon]|nr:hypothetical protein [Nanoarchaeota archaeon]